MLMVLRTSGAPTINALAQRLGLNRSENLYQIKRGNNRISLKLARTIHSCFPAYPITWLMYGERGERDEAHENEIVSLPLYVYISGQMLDSGETLDISSTLRDRATMAMWNIGATNVDPAISVMLLKVAPQFMNSKIYYLQTGKRFYLGCMSPGTMPGTIIMRGCKTKEQSVIETSAIGLRYEVCNLLPTGIK